ncbi:FAD-dependent oxidoreductase [Phenylobacterium sp.]|uniref:FAD-dependent oxidoreductase n=1 Tax=Phenylobacterium sp. TaxID=1871053 RepID=UPI00356A0490
MTPSTSTDILICGAGAAGLTLAVDLARRGVTFQLIDKAGGPFPGSRGKGIQPRSQEVFEDLGVLDRILETAGPYPPQRAHRADGGCEETLVSELLSPTPAESYVMPLLSAQFLTERALRERLEALGGRLRFGVELTGFSQDADGVTAKLTGPDGAETLRCRYLVGADGGRSFVRSALGVDFPGTTLGVRAVVADVRLEGLSRDAWHRWGEGLEMIGLCPLWGTDLVQLQGPIPLEGDVDLSAEGLRAMVAARTGRSDLVVTSVAWASAYSMNARLADRYRVGRVFLAGDAAHIHPPTGGQGLNTSLQDAYNLGWKLAAVLDGAPDGLLDSYEAERRPVAAEVLGLSKRLLDDAKAGVAMRRGRETQQLDIGYPGSPLSLAGPARLQGVEAGDRAPDAPVGDPAGRPTRLFDLFRGPHWTALGYEADERPAPRPRPGVEILRVGGPGGLADDAGHLRDAYGLAPGEWVLVRPDGYVAAVVPAGEAIDRHLDRILGPV